MKNDTLAGCIAEYITSMYGIRRQFTRLEFDRFRLKMAFLQVLYCNASLDTVLVKERDWRVINDILSHLEIYGGVSGNERELTIIKILVDVRADIKEAMKLRKLRLLIENADYVYASTYKGIFEGSYLPVWMINGSIQVLRLIKLELRRRPKYIYN